MSENMTEQTEVPQDALAPLILDRDNLNEMARRLRVAVEEHLSNASDDIAQGDDEDLVRHRLAAIASMRAGAELVLDGIERVAEIMPSGTLYSVDVQEGALG